MISGPFFRLRSPRRYPVTSRPPRAGSAASRLEPGPVSRQAVIAKALYSVSSYKTWAGKARGAFDKPK